MEVQLAGYWGELSGLAAIGAWRSLMQISGQLVEALTKYRLMAAGHTNLGRRTLGELLQIARRDAVFDAAGTAPLFDSTMSAVLILRNWASHFQMYGRNPEASEAAQALVLLIAASQALFPSTPSGAINAWPELPEGGARVILESHGPGVGVSLLSRLPPEEQSAILSEHDRAIANHLARFAAPSTVVDFEAILRRRGLPTDALRRAMTDHFPSVVRNASRSSVRKVFALLITIRRLEMNVHASILGILLPADPEFLTDLLRSRPPASVATYWAECFKANRGAIARRFGNPQARSQFVESFWSVFRVRQGSIISFANLLRTLPNLARMEVLRRAPVPDLLAWIQESGPASSANLLSSFGDGIQRDQSLVRLRGQVVDAIAESTKAAPPGVLAKLPLRLHRIKAIDPSRSHPILRAIIGRVDELRDWEAVRRITWDIYCFFPGLGDAALDAVACIISRDAKAIPIWVRMCLLGMLSISGRPAPDAAFVTDEDRLAIPATLPNDVDRWKSFLFLVGAARFGGPGFVTAGFIDSIDLLLQETSAEEATPSHLLLRAAEAAIADLRCQAAPSPAI